MVVIGIIQARMASTRLPNKTLLLIHGRPMLMRVLDRLRLCRRLDEVIVVTSHATTNDRLARIGGREIGMAYDRGGIADEDVTDRLLTVTERLHADAIVRITPDCPLIDPDLVDEVVAVGTGEQDYGIAGRNRLPVDYCSNVWPRTYPDGLDCEYITAECLSKLPASEEPTRHIWEHPDFFRIASVANPQNLSNLNWTVNYQEDLEFVRWVYERLHEGFTWHDVLGLASQRHYAPFLEGRFPNG